MFEPIRFPGYLPYYSQIGTLDLAEPIFSEKFDPIHDPGWRSLGADSPEQYAHWVMRACGIVCVKMCAEGFGKTRRTVHEWIRLGLKNNAYLIREENGKIEERGWIHKSLADLLNAEGLISQAMPASLPEICEFLRAGKLFIASVSYQLGTRFPVTFKGGHLVVVHGADVCDGVPEKVILHNPSGRYPELQANAVIPAERFLSAYTGRGILVEKP